MGKWDVNDEVGSVTEESLRAAMDQPLRPTPPPVVSPAQYATLTRFWRIAAPFN